jgi:hypothetical protein
MKRFAKVDATKELRKIYDWKCKHEWTIDTVMDFHEFVLNYVSINGRTILNTPEGGMYDGITIILNKSKYDKEKEDITK